MITFSHVIQGVEGLHARPVALICAEAKPFESAVRVSCGRAVVCASDLMGLMGLDARQGDELVVAIEGPDEQACAERMREVFTF